MEGERKLAYLAILSPKRSVNTADRGTILTFWHPCNLLPQATIHTAARSRLLQYVVRTDQWKKTILSPEWGDWVWESQDFPSTLQKEQFIQPHCVKQLYPFFLLLVCSRKQRKDVNKGRSAEQPLRLQDLIWTQAQPHICSWAYLVRPKDSEMMPHTVDWWISDYMGWSSEPNAFKKEMELLGRGFALSVDCICVRAYGFYTLPREVIEISRFKLEEYQSCTGTDCCYIFCWNKTRLCSFFGPLKVKLCRRWQC